MGHDLDNEELKATRKLMEERPHLIGGIKLTEKEKFEARLKVNITPTVKPIIKKKSKNDRER